MGCCRLAVSSDPLAIYFVYANRGAKDLAYARSLSSSVLDRGPNSSAARLKGQALHSPISENRFVFFADRGD
jgi:hypothetical protein